MPLAGESVVAAHRSSGLATLDSVIAWLYSQGIGTRQLAAWFGTNANHIRQLIFRGQHPHRKPPAHTYLTDPVFPPPNVFTRPTVFLRRQLGVRPDEDSVVLDSAGKRRLEKIEARTEELAKSFWSGVRFESGLARLTDLRSEIGYPGHFRRIRLLARIHQLIAELLLHSGRSASCLDYGFRALHLSRIAYHESEERHDLEQIGRSARLLSLAHILLGDRTRARQLLELHRQTRERLGLSVRPEYHRQMGTLAFQEQDHIAARGHFQKAMTLLAETVDYGKVREPHEILDTGRRHMNILPPVNWDGSLGAHELLDLMTRHWATGDIHVSLNVIWTAAAGFQTDSRRIHQVATELLHKYRCEAEGYARQSTVIELLLLTPKLPLRTRAEWAKRVLYENAARYS